MKGKRETVVEKGGVDDPMPPCRLWNIFRRLRVELQEGADQAERLSYQILQMFEGGRRNRPAPRDCTSGGGGM